MADPTPPPKRWYEVLAALTPLILGLAVTGVGTFFTAVNNARQTQLNQITALDKFRASLISPNASEREFAYAAFAALGYEAMALKIIQAKQDPVGRALAEEVKETSSGADRETAIAVLAGTPPVVYIHIASESQRERAEEFSQHLGRARFLVKGIENISGKAAVPRQTSVRYFNPEDQPAANAVVDALKAIGESGATAQIVTRFKVRPGSLEVWFGKVAS